MNKVRLFSIGLTCLSLLGVSSVASAGWLFNGNGYGSCRFASCGGCVKALINKSGADIVEPKTGFVVHPGNTFVYPVNCNKLDRYGFGVTDRFFTTKYSCVGNNVTVFRSERCPDVVTVTVWR